MGKFLNFILEGALPTDKDFAVVAAYSKSASEDELKVNAGKLSADLDSFVLVHQTMFNGEKGEIVYFVEKPESMDKDEFRTIIKRVARDYGTNKYILKRDDMVLCMDASSPDAVKEENKPTPSKEYLEKLYKKFFYGKDTGEEETEVPAEETEEEPNPEEVPPEEKAKNESLNESSLSRLLKLMKSGSWAILTAFRNEYDEDENYDRNKKLKRELDAKKMGVQQLIGHYEEPQKDGKKVSVEERSFFIPMPDSMDKAEFKKFVRNIAIKYEQYSALIKLFDDVYELVADTGKMTKIGNKTTLDSQYIEDMYSLHIKKKDIPFTFI